MKLKSALCALGMNGVDNSTAVQGATEPLDVRSVLVDDIAFIVLQGGQHLSLALGVVPSSSLTSVSSEVF